MAVSFPLWTYYVIKKGRSVQYEVEDLPSPLQADLSYSLGNKLEIQWQRETDLNKIRGTKPSLLKTLTRTFWKEFIRILLLHAFNDLFIAIGKQVLLGLFLINLREVQKNGYENITYVGILLILFYGLNNLLQNHFICQSYHMGCRMKVALTSLIYRKCLRLGNNAGENTSAGMIVNLLSNDMRQFDEIIMFINYSWSGMASTIIILVLLSNFIGVSSAFAGFLAVLLAMPAQIIISKSLARNRIRTAYASDKRIQIMDEIICGIHIIKMYAWEKPYEKFIQKLRDIEMKLMRKNLFLRGFQVACSITLSKFSMYVLVVVYACLGGEVLPEKEPNCNIAFLEYIYVSYNWYLLSPITVDELVWLGHQVFVLVGFCSIIAKVVCGMGFRSFGEVSQCYVSVQRIQHFLELKEFKKMKLEGSSSDEHAICFSKVKANWTVDSSRDTIKDLTLAVKGGELTTIIGQVGSGKTSLLNVILGELPISEGKVNINGTVSYYSQSPWIFAGTIRQNILFSQDFEQSRYNCVIEVCALNTDLKFLPYGDHTLVGERGVTLSGGQKARIALARTIYRHADIYLLDDPLSAVDANVAKQIFEKCFLDFLKDKTRVLVTHQLQFLKDSDKVVLLHEGCVDIEGKFEDIMTSKANYLNTLKKIQPDGTTNENEEKKLSSVVREKSTQESLKEGKNNKNELEKEENEKSSAQALIKYVSNGVGVTGFLGVLLMCILAQMFINGCEIWLTIWTHHTSSQTMIPHNASNWSFPAGLTEIEFFVSGYSAVMLGVIITVVMRNCFFAMSGYQCAKNIHNVTFKGVIHANSSFFHNNPSGRILNRFSKDLGIVDNPFTLCLLDAVTSMFQVVAAFIISSSVNPIYLIPAVIALISLIILRQFYLGTSVTLKRLENITKSPVFVHVHATMQGLPTIRSNAATDKLIEQFDQYQDTHTSAWYLYNLTSFGYAYGLEVICLLYMVAIVVGCIFLNLPGSKVGLALAQVTILLSFAQWSMKQSAEVSNQLTSIDRLLKYSSLPEEQQPEKDDLTKNWPSEGKIAFNNVSLCYDIGSAASIYDVSFTIFPLEKIGIVGRTGAGKSSLLAALFRLGYVQGSIKIDDIDTSTVRLEKLRSKISVIPQDPVLFSGTIKKNLDPFDEFGDANLWNALDQAELKDTISKEEAGLDSPVSEGGRNFSVGQRQLICLARAILRNNKILILDEATANVDQQTDSIIQRTIRNKFKSCTVLTIAHRLNTIVDSDKILVMDGGTAVEFDHPYKLLLNQKSYFYQLVSKTGSFVAAALTGIARENYNQHHIDEENEKKEN